MHLFSDAMFHQQRAKSLSVMALTTRNQGATTQEVTCCNQAIARLGGRESTGVTESHAGGFRGTPLCATERAKMGQPA
jgi:hypothetical protein